MSQPLLSSHQLSFHRIGFVGTHAGCYETEGFLNVKAVTRLLVYHWDDSTSSDQVDTVSKPLALVDMSTQMCKVRAGMRWCETTDRESLKLFQGEVSELIHTLLVCLTARCEFGIVPRLRQWQCCRCLRDWSSQHLPGQLPLPSDWRTCSHVPGQLPLPTDWRTCSHVPPGSCRFRGLADMHLA